MNNFTTKNLFFLVPSNECNEEFKKIDEFLILLEKSGIKEIIEREYRNSNDIGRKGYNPFNMFATIIFCFSEFNSSLREIEKRCLYDLRVIYIMEQQAPSYKVFGDFINKYVLPYHYEIFTRISKTIINEFKIDISDQYLDGTKIEANANKYKFVWKPTAYHQKLDIKIKSLLSEIGVKVKEEEWIKSYELRDIIKKYVSDKKIDIDKIPTGRGKRITKQQRTYKVLYQYLIKLLEYEEKEEICGENRNSYYKTDKDATAMVLKKDYYSKLSHDFHAGYNIQIMVSSGIITMYGVFQDRSDFHTLIPMNNLYFKYYNEYPKNECADAGYGVYDNYQYLKEHHIGNYVKFQSWEGEANGKRPQLFYTFPDGVLCLNTCIGEEISFNTSMHQRIKGGKLYKFTGCKECNYSYICKKQLKNKERIESDFRLYELSPTYELLKEEARENLLSPKGIEIRINRSIQVEGTFGQIKQNMHYDRIRRRGIEKVLCEIMLECLGKNIRKFFVLLNGAKVKSSYWPHSVESLKKEKFPFPKQKKKKEAVKN